MSRKGQRGKKGSLLARACVRLPGLAPSLPSLGAWRVRTIRGGEGGFADGEGRGRQGHGRSRVKGGQQGGEASKQAGNTRARVLKGRGTRVRDLVTRPLCLSEERLWQDDAALLEAGLRRRALNKDYHCSVCGAQGEWGGARDQGGCCQCDGR